MKKTATEGIVGVVVTQAMYWLTLDHLEQGVRIACGLTSLLIGVVTLAVMCRKWRAGKADAPADGDE